MIELALEIASFLFLAWFFICLTAIGLTVLGWMGGRLGALVRAIWRAARRWRENWPGWLLAFGVAATLIAAMAGGSAAAGITALSIGGAFALYLLIGACVIVVRDVIRKAQGLPIWRPAGPRARTPDAERPWSWREILTGRPDWDAELRWKGYGRTVEGDVPSRDAEPRVVRPVSKREAPKPPRRKRSWRERITGNIDWDAELRWNGYHPDEERTERDRRVADQREKDEVVTAWFVGRPLAEQEFWFGASGDWLVAARMAWHNSQRGRSSEGSRP